MKKTKKKAQVPLRLNIFFLFVFILFSLLILQLGVVQILNGEEARQRLNETENTRATISVPRGLMYDRFGRLILDNEPERSITYTPPKNGDSNAVRLEIAERLASMMSMADDIEDLKSMVRDRDMREYWFNYSREHRLIIQERLEEHDTDDLSTSEVYQLQLSLITDSDLNQFDWDDPFLLNTVAIKKELDQAFELSPHTIKNSDVTEEEYAFISENLGQLPGIDAKIDWNRVRPFDRTFSSFVGNVTSSNEGIPLDNQDYFLSLGYSRNDRVGTSGLEQQYESYLRGQKEIIQYTTDTEGNIIGTSTVLDGKSGHDLVLTVDMDFQYALDNIVQEELEAYINQDPYQNRFMSEALVAVLDPKTGDVLALSAAHYDRDEDEYKDQAYRVVHDAHIPGSTIKGATVLAGYEHGVINIGTVFNDRPIRIAETREKSSWRNFGPINDLRAIEQSSNVYMFEIAIGMSGATYRPDEPLYNYNSDAFQWIRNYFHQFGLGTHTGIDLPFETTGLAGTEISTGGLLLDFAIGQYDTFSTLQLAQYVSTIANDGYRLQPRLVKEVRQTNGNKEELGPILESFSPRIMNRIDMDQVYIDRVKEGFRRVATDGTGRGYWSDSPYQPAIKTGTAQNQFFVDGVMQSTNNLALVGYAPYDEPELAFAVLVPRAGIGNDQNGIHHNIGNRLLNEYYEIKERRERGQLESFGLTIADGISEEVIEFDDDEASESNEEDNADE